MYERMARKHDININEYMSPQFIYNNRKNQDSEGMYGRDVMNILRKKGICFEKNYEYGKIESPNQIEKKLYDIAKNHIISNYARVYTIDALKKALIKNGPCYIAVPVYNYSTTMWKPDNPGDQSKGGHAMTLVGYNTEGFIIRNSWGEELGR